MSDRESLAQTETRTELLRRLISLLRGLCGNAFRGRDAIL